MISLRLGHALLASCRFLNSYVLCHGLRLAASSRWSSVTFRYQVGLAHLSLKPEGATSCCAPL